MQEVFRRSPRGGSDASVLLIGESGPGRSSWRVRCITTARARGPLRGDQLRVIPETLLESELFGTKRARSRRRRLKPGKFEVAGGAPSSSTRSARSPRRAGEAAPLPRGAPLRARRRTEPVAVDVRIVSATNQNSTCGCARTASARTSYFRLNVVRVDIRPCASGATHPALVAHFLDLARGAGVYRGRPSSS